MTETLDIDYYICLDQGQKENRTHNIYISVWASNHLSH